MTLPFDWLIGGPAVLTPGGTGAAAYYSHDYRPSADPRPMVVVKTSPAPQETTQPMTPQELRRMAQEICMDSLSPQKRAVVEQQEKNLQDFLNHINFNQSPRTPGTFLRHVSVFDVVHAQGSQARKIALLRKYVFHRFDKALLHALQQLPNVPGIKGLRLK